MTLAQGDVSPFVNIIIVLKIFMVGFKIQHVCLALVVPTLCLLSSLP